MKNQMVKTGEMRGSMGFRLSIHEGSLFLEGGGGGGGGRGWVLKQVVWYIWEDIGAPHLWKLTHRRE